MSAHAGRMARLCVLDALCAQPFVQLREMERRGRGTVCGPSEGLGCRRLLPGKGGCGLETVGPEGVLPKC